MNFTLDDTASQLSYSGWAAQSSADSNASQFFGGTYHVAQVNGATLNMSVAGSALYIFGSMGPRHGQFSVQVDDTIGYYSANASDTRFQQILFSTTFDPQKSSPYFVSLTAMLSDEGPWLDVDFVTTGSSTNSSNSSPVTALPNTMSAPWQTSPTAISFPTPSIAGSVGSSASHTQKLNIATEVLAILFGSVIALATLLSLSCLLLRRRYDRHRAKERSFRVGSAGDSGHGASKNGAVAKKLAIGVPMNFHHTASHDSLLATGNANGSSVALSSSPSSVSLSDRLNAGHNSVHLIPVNYADAARGDVCKLLSPPPSPYFGTLASSSSLTLTTASGETKMSDASSKALLTLAATNNAGGYMYSADARGDVAADYVDPAGGLPGTNAAGEKSTVQEVQRSSPKAFAFLSTAPSAFNVLKRMSKGDADSMKTNFLQV